MSWTTVALGDLCEINVGKTPSRANKSYWANGTEPWLSIADMTKGFLVTNTKECITKEAVKSCNCKLVATGTVLMSFKLSVGKVSLATFPLYTNEAIAALPIKNKTLLCEEYLVHALKSIDLYLGTDRAAMGLTLNKDKLKRIPIPLPPLAQQQSIAAILDKAAEIKAKREQAIAKLDELAQSTFVEMFGDVAANDKGWQTVTLGSVTSKLGSGATPSGGDASYKAEGIPLIRSLNVHDGEFVYKNLAYIDDEQAEKLSNVIVQKNDVLLNITGASVARVCRVPDAVVPARVNQHVMIVRPTEKINPIFLERQLLTARMKQKLLQVGGAGATREAITKAQAAELKVICPPITLQKKFAEIAKWIEKLKAQEIDGLASLQKLTSSLQHQAFTTGFNA